MNIYEYWQGVRQVAATLPETVYIVSVDNQVRGTSAGMVCACTREVAARRIFEGTHRLAAEEEIAAYLASEDAERRRIVEEEYRRKQQFALPSELAELVRLAVEQRSGRSRG
jgi:hypothetical protein